MTQTYRRGISGTLDEYSTTAGMKERDLMTKDQTSSEENSKCVGKENGSPRRQDDNKQPGPRASSAVLPLRFSNRSGIDTFLCESAKFLAPSSDFER